MSEAAPGYVLTLRDITADLGHHRDRERLLGEFLDKTRRPAAGLRALLDLRAEAASPAGTALTNDILYHAEALCDAVQHVATAHDTAWRSWWPMQDVRASEVIDGLRAHLEEHGPLLEARPVAILLRCDGVAIIDLLSVLARAVHSEGLAHMLSLDITLQDGVADCRLSWQGAPMPVSVLERLLDAPMDAIDSDLSGREVLEHHGTEVWPDWDTTGRAWLTLPCPMPARCPNRRPPAA